MRRFVLLLLVAGCSPGADRPRDSTSTSRALDEAAIESGQLPDPTLFTAAGAYAADTDIGEDRLCVVEAGETLRVGLLVSYGTGGACLGRGKAERRGDRLRLALQQECAFDATLDGQTVVIPGALPDECRALCSGRALLAGVTFPKTSDVAADALALTDLDDRPLCPTTN